MSAQSIRQSLEAKRLEHLNLDEVVFAHLDLGSPHWTQDMVLNSCLEEIEREMRATGTLRNTQNYAPLLCGFSLLDQIGNVYSDTTKSPVDVNKSGIIKALHYFGNHAAGSAESDALYALRNAVAHNSSLTIETRAGLWFIFRYNRNQPETIKLPSLAWDGTAANITRVTIFNPAQFVEDVSDVLQNVRSVFATRRADLGIASTKEEILHRYLFWSRRPPPPAT